MTRGRRNDTALWAAAAAGARMFHLVATALVVLFLCSGITTIAPHEVGLLLRFGRLAGASPAEAVRQPGLLLALPAPLDELLRVPVRQEGQVVIEDLWQPLTAPNSGDRIDPVTEGYCLTGDQYLLQAKFVVKYRLRDPIRARLRINHVEAMLRDMAIAALTQTVAQWGIDDAWRRHRAGAGGEPLSLERAVESALHARLTQLDLGLTVSALEFQEIHPPRHVHSDFADVQNALAESQQARDKAEGEAAAIRLAGESERRRLEQEAAAERERALAQAAAEATIVKDLLPEYRANPEFVRQRLRLEALSDIQQRGLRQKVLPPGQSWRVIISDREAAP